jgi:arylsulfate sulfotransferase
LRTFNRFIFCPLVVSFGVCASAFATVSIGTFTPSHVPPEPIGKTIIWATTATDTNTGPLTFQFNIRTPGSTEFKLVKDFNVGSLASGTWTAQPFIWVPTGVEGSYQIQVVAKDFTSGETDTRTVSFKINAVVTGSSPVIVRTANPLVVLFSAPACPAGSTIRVVFQEHSTTPPPPVMTNWQSCHPSATETFEIAGILPSTSYHLYAEINTGGAITNGTTIAFKTEALPSTVPFPTFTVKTPATDTTYPVILHNMIQLGGGTTYPDVATDLAGNVIWYYYANDLTNGDVMTRPLQNGGFITMQDDVSWDPVVTKEQLLRQIDLAGNIVRETNMGIVQQQLLALGAVNGGPCPPPSGAGCAGAFHHDAIQTLPNGYTAALLDVEKLFPPGTQGDTSGLPVDIIGDMIIVMDTDWQVKWYWDSFDPSHGGNGYARLPITRTAVLGETCGSNTAGCPPVFLLGPNVAPLAHDWLHANTLYYWPHNGEGGNAPGDIIWSSRHQDWVFKIDYQDMKGTGDIVWRMGPSGDFIFQNAYSDPWPWFSHQHDVGIENNGAGPITIFDNGNTRISKSSVSTGGVPGLGSSCGPNDCNSRGMAISFDQTGMTVTVSPNGVSLDLGSVSPAMGSAQLLANGNYFFENPLVLLPNLTTAGYSMEFSPLPPAPQVGAANVLLDLGGPEHYRGWQMQSLYFPPTT